MVTIVLFSSIGCFAKGFLLADFTLSTRSFRHCSKVFIPFAAGAENKFG